MDTDARSTVVVSGKTLGEWETFARTDRCLDQMVPSDLRQFVKMAIEITDRNDELKAVVRQAIKAIAEHNVDRLDQPEAERCNWDFGESYGGTLDVLCAAVNEGKPVAKVEAEQ